MCFSSHSFTYHRDDVSEGSLPFVLPLKTWCPDVYKTVVRRATKFHPTSVATLFFWRHPESSVPTSTDPERRRLSSSHVDAPNNTSIVPPSRGIRIYRNHFSAPTRTATLSLKANPFRSTARTFENVVFHSRCRDESTTQNLIE